MKMQFNRQIRRLCKEVTKFDGVHFTDTESQLPLSVASDMANMYVDENGALKKRTGYKRLWSGDGRINGFFCYPYVDGGAQKKQYFIHVGNALYFCHWTENGLVPGACITTALQDKKSRSFVFGGALYILGAGYFKLCWDAAYKMFQCGRVWRTECEAAEPYVFMQNAGADDVKMAYAKSAFLSAEHRYKEIEFAYARYSFTGTQKLYVAPASVAGGVHVESVHYVDDKGAVHTLAPEHYQIKKNANGLYVMLQRNDIGLDAYKYCAPHIVITYNGFVYTPTNVINRSPTSMLALDDTVTGTPMYDGVLLQGYNLAAPQRAVEFYITKQNCGSGSAVRLYLEPRNSKGAVLRVFLDGNLIQKYTVVRSNGSEPFLGSYACEYVEFEKSILPETDCVVRVEYVKEMQSAPQTDACSIFDIFGGENDTRVFLAGNAACPACDFASDLYEGTYFPDRGYTQIGADRSAIVGYHKISGYQVILKDGLYHDASQYLRSMHISEDGSVYFSVQQGVQGVGACSVSSFKNCNDRLLFAATDGVYEIRSTNVDAQTNLKCLSVPVQCRLEKEELANAVCAVFAGKYYLAVGSRMYILDVTRDLRWYFYCDLPEITCMYSEAECLVFGAADGGVYCFMAETDADAYYDNVAADGALTDARAIVAYWDMPVTTLGSGWCRKSIEDLAIYLAPQNKTSLRVYYTTEFSRNALQHEEHMGRFDFSSLDFADFAFNASDFPVCINTRAKAKRVRVFGARFSNAVPGEGLILTGFALQYRENKAIK